MKAHSDISTKPWRLYSVVTLILLIVLALMTRVVDLTLFKQHFLMQQGNSRAMRTVMTPAFRGMITDREGYPLAISTTVFSVWIDPKEFLPKTDTRSLAQLLSIPNPKLAATIQKAQKKHREFVFLKRELSPEVAAKVKALHLSGIHLQEDFKRFYPAGEVAAHVIGFTNIDDQGQEGLELLYNSWLTGTSGKNIVLKDRIGREVSNLQTVQEQKPGNDITLSIDRRIQYLAYRELMTGIQDNLAASGTVVILDVKTGEVLAMVNQPSYNPNDTSTKNNDALRNRAIIDTFEPGSTMKAFSVAVGLMNGYKPDTMINTSPGWFRVEHHLVRDENDEGTISVSRVLQLSSDIGVSKMVLSSPPNSLYNLLKQMGFGEVTGIGFPGEASGRLVKPAQWKPFALATLSFGYGVSVTTLQLAHAYAAIANHGVMLPLSLLKVETPPAGKQVMDRKIADEMLAMLETVVNTKAAKNFKAALGVKAAVPGYRVAGKTGTSKLLGAHGYERRYTSSFIGIAPVSNPRFVVAVVIRDPRGKVYYGADVSAPVFERIMEGTLRILDVPPDNLSALQKTS